VKSDDGIGQVVWWQLTDADVREITWGNAPLFPSHFVIIAAGRQFRAGKEQQNRFVNSLQTEIFHCTYGCMWCGASQVPATPKRFKKCSDSRSRHRRRRWKWLAFRAAMAFRLDTARL